MTVVVGVDGAGRTHRLGEIAAAATTPVVRVDGSAVAPADGGTDGGTDGGVADELTTGLAAAEAGRALVAVDDAHRLPATVLRALTAAARGGAAMAITRRPTVGSPELAALDEAVAAHGAVELLGPLDEEGVAAVIAAVTGRPASLDLVAPVREASAGLPAVVAALAAVPPGTTAPALVARVQRRLALLDPPVAELARTLALRLDLSDEVLAGAAGLPPSGLAPAMRALRDRGMLAPPDGERMVPAVAQAVLAELSPAERRRRHDAVARALVDAGGDPVAAATQLSTARARTGGAAEVYRAAAERLRFRDPAAAAAWYDDALDAGADPATLAAGRAEAAALLGRPVDPEQAAAPADRARVALAAGAAAAHQGRADRAAEALRGAGGAGPLLAVPALVATGQLDAARAAVPAGVGAGAGAGADAGAAPVALRRLAEAVLAVGDPATALPLLIEAAEAVEQAPPAMVLPDTPHAVGALVAVTAGDPASAEHLLDRALAAGVGGSVAADRHRTVLAWVRLRTGHYGAAVAELRRLSELRQRAEVPLPGRERLLAAALSAGVARRSGDIARLREAWGDAEPVLARRAVDLFQLEPVEELLVAAARLRQHDRVAPVLDALARIVDRLDRPAAWAASLGWIRLQLAVAGEDAAAAAAAAHQLDAAAAGPDAGPRQLAQRDAAGRWARALAGEVDPDAVAAAADTLAAAQLPWEASRLAGHAAIRTGDAAAARRLLEHARDLAAADPATADGRTDPSYGGLSDREREVAQLVLDGRTYREIGSQLYLSPKTVEHHVARVRSKLGATSRAELIAALRRVLAG